MADQDKARRKQLRRDLRKQAKAASEQHLPMSLERFEALFSYLDIALGSTACDDTNRWVRTFLKEREPANTDEALQWLAGKGGHCDCEILTNAAAQSE